MLPGGLHSGWASPLPSELQPQPFIINSHGFSCRTWALRTKLGSLCKRTSSYPTESSSSPKQLQKDKNKITLVMLTSLCALCMRVCIWGRRGTDRPLRHRELRPKARSYPAALWLGEKVTSLTSCYLFCSSPSFLLRSGKEVQSFLPRILPQ